MKISKVETIRPLDHPNVLWILLHDDQGNVGLGETFLDKLLSKSMCITQLHQSCLD